MAMTERDIEDFLGALQRSADLRERVRSVLLADDFLALPGLVRANTEAIAALVERMSAVEARLERVESRLERVEARLEGVEARLGLVEKRLNDVAGRLGNVEGEVFEWKYDRQASGRLGLRFKNVRVLRLGDEGAMHQALESGKLSDDDWDDAIRTDCVARGVSKATGDEMVLVIEVSKTVDESDVVRANQRADILRKVWPISIAAVDGDQILPVAKALALQLGVTMFVQREAPAPPAA